MDGGYTIVEAVAGFMSGSLALLAHAGHMLTDAVFLVLALVTMRLVWAFGWQVADPVTSMLIGVLILTSTRRLLSRVVDVLLEGTPEHIDLYALCHKLEELDGVTVIHDVHCWTPAPGYVALTAHMLVDPAYVADGGHEILLDRVRDIAYDEFDIQHITVQLETTAGRCLEAHHVDHLLATARAPL